MTRCIVFSEMHFNSPVNGGELNSMKGTHTLDAVQRFFSRSLFHVTVKTRSRSGLLFSLPLLSTAKTASLCILSRAPCGPICTAQFTGVASDLLEEKLRPFSLIRTL